MEVFVVFDPKAQPASLALGIKLFEDENLLSLHLPRLHQHQETAKQSPNNCPAEYPVATTHSLNLMD